MAAHEPLIVFPHVRKTAGTTTREILRRQYTERRAVQQVENYFTRGRRCHDALRAIAASPPSELRVAHGHILVWPDIEWPQGTRFFTILRDPVERTISHYSWLGARSAAKRKMTLEAVLADGKIHDNLQCRVLAGSEEPIGKTTRRTLDAALAALDRLDVVGLTERFDESLLLLTQAFGWKRMVYKRVNVTEGRWSRDEIPASTLDLVRRHNALDLELYERACERFARDVAGQGEGFATDVAVLRLAAARYAAMGDDQELSPPTSPRALIEAQAELLLREQMCADLAERVARAEDSLESTTRKMIRLQAKTRELSDARKDLRDRLSRAAPSSAVQPRAARPSAPAAPAPPPASRRPTKETSRPPSAPR